MGQNIIGRFYFKQTASGNIIGEFSNDISKSNITESGDKLNGSQGFVGNFNTTWQEEGIMRFATLEIKSKKNCPNIYTLRWVVDNEDDDIGFWGEGFVVDGMLIGDYRNFDLDVLKSQVF